MQAIAREAGVGPSVVYYHFAGKPDLYEAALRQVFGAVIAVVVATRTDQEPGGPGALDAVLTAVWEWLDENCEACQLLFDHVPGMTTRVTTLRARVRGDPRAASPRLLPARTATSRGSGISQDAAEMLAARTLDRAVPASSLNA